MTLSDRERFCKEWEHARQTVLKCLKRKRHDNKRDSSGKRF